MRSPRDFKSDQGFTLLEITIVLAITGYLLKQLVAPFGAGFEQQRNQATHQQLATVIEAVIGFASVHQRLPCPASEDSHGHELESCGGAMAHGFVPAVTLGLNGPFNERGQLLDSWGTPIVYAVSGSDHAERGSPGKADFSSIGEMREVGLRFLRSDLLVCRQPTDGSCSRNQIVANQVPFIVISMGKDKSGAYVQHENQNQDSMFVAQAFSNSEEQPFDDIVVWISENNFFYELIRAGVLP